MSVYTALQGTARKVLRTRRAYNLARRSMLVWNHLFRIPHEPDFRFFAAFPDLDGLIVDVGANGGQSIVSFNAFLRRAPILSFEPNPDLHRELSFVLRHLKRGPSRFLPYALGEADGHAVLNIPHQGDLPIDARASILAGTPSARGIEVEVRRFDGLGDQIGAEPAIVKVDVEGFEAPVLRGMAETLRRAAPLVLFERSESLAEVAAVLDPLGYTLFGYDAGANRLRPLAEVETINVFALSAPWIARCTEAGLVD